MAAATLGSLLRHLTRGTASEALPDRQLVERALAGNDPAAFEAVVRRHGPMVYRVCRRALHHEQDAEDAFQATFLVFAQNLRSLRKHTSLASWLHGVARRVALKARARVAARRRHEGRAPASREVPPAEVTWAEVRTALDDELARLPERWRLPLVLCYLEGRTQDEAARQLGWSKITLRRRLDEARAALGRRLTLRGAAWPGALSAVLLSDCLAPAVPPGLAGPTAEAAALVAAGKAAPAVPAGVAALTQGVMPTMTLTKLRAAAALLLAAAVAGGALSASAYRAPAQDQKGSETKSQQPPEAAAKQGKEDPRIKGVLELALKDAAAIRDPFQRLAAYGYIAKAQARAGRQDAAKDTLRKALEAEDREMGAAALQHKDSRMIMAAEFQVEIGDLNGALKTIELDVSDMNHDAALSRVAVCRALNGDLKGALETAESIKAAVYKGDALRTIAVRLAEAGDMKGAVKAANRIADEVPSKCLALAAIASARAKAGDRDGAARLLPAVRAAAARIQEKAKFFGPMAVAEAEAAAGMADAAIKTVGEIEDGLSHAEALQHLAATQAARGEVPEARQTAEAIPGDYNQGEALKQVVAALVRARDLPAAEKLANSIRHDMGHCYALLEVARAQAAAGRKGDAQKTLEEAYKLADRLQNPDTRIKGVREAALSHWAEARAAIGDPVGALAWAEKQADPWVRAISRISVTTALSGGPRR
jgi:RNA polymerase sigma factor (sigma-70 family)